MKTWFKRNLIGGVVVLAPIAVAAYVIYWVYRRLATFPGSGLFELTNSAPLNNLITVMVAIVVILVGLTAAGSLVRTALGVVVQRRLDDVANRIPGLRLLYNATKMAVETMLGDGDEFQEAVKLEIGGVRVTGFATGRQTEDGRELVFVPTAPNITSGYVVEVEPERIQETEESVEEALTRVLSAGFAEEGEEHDDGRSFGV